MARPKKLPTVLTEDEQEQLLQQANPRYPTGKRNQTMIRLMLNTGLRLAEVTALKWRDLNLTTGKLMVRQGKGHKDRTLWVAEAAPGGGVCGYIQARLHHVGGHALGAPLCTADGEAVCSQGRD
jgi:site-specific recombinase XerD